jgi:hypothetical protein
MQHIVIAAFRLQCLFGVLIITVIGVAIGAQAYGPLGGVFVGGLAFLAAAFVAGGALTLLAIDASLKRLVEIAEAQTTSAKR